LREHLQTGCPQCVARLAWLRPLLELLDEDESPAPTAAVLAQAKALYRAPQTAATQRWQPLPREGGWRVLLARQGWWVVVALALIVVVVGMAYYFTQSQALPRTGTVTSIERGSLQLQGAERAPWVNAKEGQVVGQGSRLRSGPDTVATLVFFDHSVLRIEAAGEWAIKRVEGDRAERSTTVLVRQIEGRASLVAAPPQRGREHQLRVEVSEARVDLVGAATFATLASEVTQMTLLQGRATIFGLDEVAEARAGQVVILDPRKPLEISER
jgi:hypothetical protein